MGFGFCSVKWVIVEILVYCDIKKFDIEKISTYQSERKSLIL